MRIPWADVRNEDLIRFDVTLPTGVDNTVEAFIALSPEDDPDETHVLENSPRWMGDVPRRATGTVELLHRPIGSRSREPRGWQGNAEDALWGLILSPGYQHYYESHTSLCGAVRFYSGPCFTHPLPAFEPCQECTAVLGSRDPDDDAVRVLVHANAWEHGWELSVAGNAATQVEDLERAEQQVRDWLDTDDPATDHSGWVITVVERRRP